MKTPVDRVRNRLRYISESLLLRGTQYRLLFIAAVIALISVLGGVAVLLGTGDFGGFGEATWWAFLRLTDPGYLGDDEGLLRRSVSTVVTVLGYVFFMGALIAIMTQWLNSTIERLQRGETPIELRGHFLVLGWSERTATLVGELLASEGRARRFLQRKGHRRLRIVIMAPHLDEELAADIRGRLGHRWSSKAIKLRSGSPLRVEHLDRVALESASVIILPGGDFESSESHVSDTGIVKALLSIGSHEGLNDDEELPRIVAELSDERVASAARQTYRGPLELLASDRLVSHLVSQNLRHPGYSHIIHELLSHDYGNQVYVRELDRFEGRLLWELTPYFENATLLGLVRQGTDGFRAFVGLQDDQLVRRGDQAVLIARDYETSHLGAAPVGTALEFGDAAALPPVEQKEKNLLILGWNRRVPTLVRLLDSYSSEVFNVELISAVPSQERKAYVDSQGGTMSKSTLQFLDGDFTTERTLRALDLEKRDAIIIVGSDWLENESESDARSILAFLQLRAVLGDRANDMNILIELLDPYNRQLLKDQPVEVIVSPTAISYLLAQVGLRPELLAVFTELFGVGGAEIYFDSARRFGLSGSVPYIELEKAAASHGVVCLGVRSGEYVGRVPGGVLLNPGRKEIVNIGDDTELVLLGQDRENRV